MHIAKLEIEGFKLFERRFYIKFNKGLNVIVGENGAGKTAAISAIRQLFSDSEASRYTVSEQDFHRKYDALSKPADRYTIKASFEDLTAKEKIAFVHWTETESNICLNLTIDNDDTRGKYRRRMWGGISQSSNFEYESLEYINCIYLPPLRDAETKLSNGYQSRLARLIKALCKKELKECRENDRKHPLEEKVKKFNSEIIGDPSFKISRANELIRDSLKKAVGEYFSQSTQIQFSENNFSRIVEGLQLLYFPSHLVNEETIYRGMEENSLGYNNLIYIASILAELCIDDDENREYLKLLLIEEPEAHLHPQLQIRLLKYLQQVASDSNVQVIVTTHSTVLASSISIDSIIHLCKSDSVIATSIASCAIAPKSKSFLNRWLDATKSNMLFAKGIILAEGISEVILLPEFARIVLHDRQNGQNSLEDLGVSVVNMNGIYFNHFMSLYYDSNAPSKMHIPVKCSGITDNDPPKSITVNIGGIDEIRDFLPCPGNTLPGENHILNHISIINSSLNCRLYSCEFKTFEYDLALIENNRKIMASVLSNSWQTDGPIKAELDKISNSEWNLSTSNDEKARVAHCLLGRIEDKTFGKGLFAQLLAEEIAKNPDRIKVPEYIKNAIEWVCQ